ncbi:MAG: DUF58 domain-containing protein [Spirochaetales bacterium]|nr:DUF58 domain-containing protein [Spirochaetales bacterium]MCF7938150.1 DUF58 domain-containing protein [Spirochaetales bacterium]
MDLSELAAKVKHIRLVSEQLVESLLSGDYHSVFKGPGIDFDEVREYVEGDDARRIDWNVSSRMGSPFTKVFREERELVLMLVVDLSASLMTASADTTKRDVVAQIAAMLAFAATANNDRVGGLLFTDRIENWVPPNKGKTHSLRLVQDILSADPKGKGSDLGLAIRTTHEYMNRRGICIVISDFRSAGYWRDLSVLSKKHDVVAVRVYDPLDYQFPKGGLIRLEDPETGDQIYGAGFNPRFRQKYHEFWNVERMRWTAECNRRRIEYVEVGTEEDPAQKLIRFFRRRKKRAWA